MKVVLALAVLALLAIGVNGTAQRLGMVTSNTVTLTSSDLSTAAGWAIVPVTTPTTYVADGSGASLHTVFNVTWTGTLPTDIQPSAYIALTGSGGINQFDSSCSAATGVYSAGGATRDGNFLTYDSTLSPRFLASGTATATVTLYFPPGTAVASSTFTFTTTGTGFSPAAGNRPTISAFTLASSFSAVDVVAANVTLANTAAGFYTVSLVFTAVNNNQGVAWVTSASTDNGVIGNEASSWSTLSPFLGSWCGDSFSGGPAAGIDLPTGTNLVIRSVTVAGTAGSSSYGPSASFLANNAIAVTSGETDVTPPTCTGAVFADPLDVATASTPLAAKTLTLACTDNVGGSGLAYTGAFVRATATGITYDYAANNYLLVNAVNIPLHYSGSINVIGVWSMDGAGNTVVYGSCGGVSTGAPQSVCGEGGEGSSSSVVIASISVVIMCILAVLAL